MEWDVGFESRAASDAASRVEPLPPPVVEVPPEESDTSTPAPLPEPLDEDPAGVEASRAALRRSSAEAASPSESPKIGDGAATHIKLMAYAQVVRRRMRMERYASLMYRARLG